MSQKTKQDPKAVLEQLKSVVKYATLIGRQMATVYMLHPRAAMFTALTAASWEAVSAEIGRKDFLLLADQVFTTSRKLKEAQDEAVAKKILERVNTDETDNRAHKTNTREATDS